MTLFSSVEQGGFRWRPSERGTVQWRRTQIRKRLSVGDGGIPHVGLPAVIGIGFRGLEHVGIAVGFGQNAGRGNRGHLGIAFDKARMRRHVRSRGEPIAINQQMVRLSRQTADGPAHGFERGLQDVHSVDFLWRHEGNSPSNRLRFDAFSQALTLRCREFFAVVQRQTASNPCVQHHSRCNDWASQATASRFVTARLDTALHHLVQQSLGHRGTCKSSVSYTHLTLPTT